MSNKVEQQATIRRMNNGGLALYVGDVQVAGIIRIEVATNMIDTSLTSVIFANHALHFDTEPRPPEELH